MRRRLSAVVMALSLAGCAAPGAFEGGPARIVTFEYGVMSPPPGHVGMVPLLLEEDSPLWPAGTRLLAFVEADYRAATTVLSVCAVGPIEDARPEPPGPLQPCLGRFEVTAFAAADENGRVEPPVVAVRPGSQGHLVFEREEDGDGSF